jgi:glycosidase
MNRFLWAAGNDQRRLRLAAFCQFTLPGQPIIYYGTEVGLSQERDVRQAGRGLPEESRLPMLWGSAQDTDLLAYYRQLVSLRRAYPALRQPGLDIIHAQGHLLAYTRKDLLVCLNLGENPDALRLPMRDASPQVLLQANQSPALRQVADSEWILSLPGLSAALIKA